MRQTDRDRLTAYYGEKLKTYGYDTRSLGWTPGGQKVRFGALAGIDELNGRSILDVGCGFGDFYGYLQDRGIIVDYTGVDVNDEFIAIARQAYPEARFVAADFENVGAADFEGVGAADFENVGAADFEGVGAADFEEGGIDATFDWAFAAGIFTIRLSDNEAFVDSMLRKMFACCRKGFAADFLRPPCGDGTGDEYWRPQPETIVKICRSLSRRIMLRCDYMADEFCVYVYKNDMADERNVFEGYRG